MLRDSLKTSTSKDFSPFAVGNYMFKVNNRNTKTRCEIYSKLTIRTLERCSSVSIVNSRQVNASYDLDQPQDKVIEKDVK